MRIRSESKTVGFYYMLFTAGFLLFVYFLGLVEKNSGPGIWLGYVF